MNLKWLPALALATQLQAGIIELPQDTQIWQLKPYQERQVRFFDEALNGSWVSLYGALNGGTLFDTDFTTLTWNLTNSGYYLRYIVINDGRDSTKIFRLTSTDTLEGNLLLSSFNNAQIVELSLYGHIPGQPAPDEGATVTLMVLGLICLLAIYDKKTVS